MTLIIIYSSNMSLYTVSLDSALHKSAGCIFNILFDSREKVVNHINFIDLYIHT